MDTLPQDRLIQKAPRGAFCFGEKLRNEGRRRPIVLVGVVAPVRVELDLTVVEVEVRGVIEADIGIRITVSVHLCHQGLNMVPT